MALKPEKKTTVPLLAEDTYCGVCYAVIDLGKQYSEKYKKTSHKIMFIWEITGQTVEIDGKPEPRVISREYTLTWGDKSRLKEMSDALFGSNAYTDETFEARLVLGTPCLLSVGIDKKDDGGQYNKVTTITKLLKGLTVHEPQELLYYEIGDASTHGVFEKIPEWIREKIKKSVDFENKVDIPANSDKVNQKAKTETVVSTTVPTVHTHSKPEDIEVPF